MKIVKEHETPWVLGDPETAVVHGAAVQARPIYLKGKRAGVVLLDFAEALIGKLSAPDPEPPAVAPR